MSGEGGLAGDEACGFLTEDGVRGSDALGGYVGDGGFGVR